MWGSFSIIIPHLKIVSRDWLTKVGYSIMSTGEMSTGKTSNVFTDSTGSHCCFHWYCTTLGFVRYNKTHMPCQCGYPDGMFPLWETFHQDTHTGKAYLYNFRRNIPGMFHECNSEAGVVWWTITWSRILWVHGADPIVSITSMSLGSRYSMARRKTPSSSLPSV